MDMLKAVQFIGHLTDKAPQFIKAAPKIFTLFAAAMDAFHALQPEHQQKLTAAFTEVAHAVEANKPPQSS